MFHYSRHIRIRMRQRGLSEKDIEDVVTYPDRTQPSFRGRHLAQKRFRGKLLEVVYRREGERIALITAYWLD